MNTKRGKKSAAELNVVPIERAIKPPSAPADLSNEMKAEWNAVVERMPPDWFTRETHGILTQYCRHVISARRVAQLIDQTETDNEFCVQDYNRLLKMQSLESANITSLATKMRLTQQSKYSEKAAHTAAKNANNGPKPWEV
tara:strand:+ start:96595 stop:97017 length:423 start_codon:yes stop_codon:yes gene_type:complete